jgi:hypothetical protein
MTQRLENYIREMIRQLHEGWPGLLSAYDVVNEAVNDSGIDRMQDSDWYLTFGDNSYIMKAFEFARKYTKLYNENQVKLYYNDYSTAVAAKADGIVRLLTPVFQAGFLDGIGMQEHDANGSPTAAAFIASYNKFAPICTEMAVTELDVTTGSATPTAGQLQTQANQYGLLFKCFVERSLKSGRGKIINVSKDGLNDTYTFKTNQSSSLWDGNNQCKPAFFQVANVGLYYNALDSMITAARLIQQGAYTNASWSAFQSALTAAITARDQNYTVNQAVDAALNTAKNNLSSAINGLTTIVSGVGSHESDVPATFALFQNHPNPFNPTTTIRYQLPALSTVGESAISAVKLEVFDALGRVVATIVNGEQSAGLHVVTWNARNLPSGIYVCRIVAGNFVASRKMLLTK